MCANASSARASLQTGGSVPYVGFFNRSGIEGGIEQTPRGMPCAHGKWLAGSSLIQQIKVRMKIGIWTTWMMDILHRRIKTVWWRKTTRGSTL
jgi:hypothetical protein